MNHKTSNKKHQTGIGFIVLMVLLFSLQSGYAQMVAWENYNTGLEDTIKAAESKASEIIEEVIENKKSPEKEKVEYLSQLTKYGFKNLFNKFKYNPRQPYSTQVNPNAENYMQDYLRAHTNNLEKMKTWGLPYFNLIDDIFSRYGLPKELKYLAVIESNLSTNATSWVGAGGPWQFMPATAKEYGLVVSSLKDDRRDYNKSTVAAARYLLSLYNQLQDWLLVIAAYNGGPGMVNNAIKKSGSTNFWDLQYYLPQESRNHVKKFIATHYIMEGNASSTGSLSSFGYQPNIASPGETTSSQNNELTKELLTGKYSSAIIARNLSIDIKEFNRYNPGFDNMLAINGEYNLSLPEEKMQQFLLIKYQILNECVQMLLDDSNIPSNKTVYTSYANSYKTLGKRKKRFS